MASDTPPSEEILCYCNRASVALVKSAIEAGASSLGQVYDRCGAGVGPCGGACRVRISALLDEAKGTAPSSSEEAPPPALIEAISLFNRHYYWECHEVLEKEWMDEYGKKRLFYQGIIQAAAALYHVLNANPAGVIRLAAEASNKLQAYRPKYLGVPLEDLLEKLSLFIAEAKEILAQSRSGFDYLKLPYLTIGTEMDTPKRPLP
jgi:predicted metal-dependent hydrolase/bacterioferritin-associated ferredoxin